MSNSTKNGLINNLSLKYGLLMGVVTVVLSVIFHIVDPILQFINVWVIIINIVVIIALLVVLGLDVRKNAGGYWSFGEALRSLLIIVALFIVISTAYNYILIKYIEPDLPSKVNAAMLDKLTTALDNAGLDQTRIDEKTKPFQDGEFEAKLQPTLKNEMISLGGGFLLYGIIGLIIAASTKKTAPLYASSVDEGVITN